MIYLLYNYRLFINSIYIIIDNNVKNVNCIFPSATCFGEVFFKGLPKKNLKFSNYCALSNVHIIIIMFLFIILGII